MNVFVNGAALTTPSADIEVTKAKVQTRKNGKLRKARALGVPLTYFAEGFEFAPAVLAMVRRPQWLESLTTPAGLLGLAGQLGFALMPWWVRGR